MKVNDPHEREIQNRKREEDSEINCRVRRDDIGAHVKTTAKPLALTVTHWYLTAKDCNGGVRAHDINGKRRSWPNKRSTGKA